MLMVTEDAGAHLAELLDDAKSPEGVAVRFVRDGDNVAMELDQEREGDTAIAYGDRTVLLLDDSVAAMLTNRTLDVEDGDDGPMLALS